MGSFIADGKKPKSGMSSASAQSLGAANMLSFGNPLMEDSPTSQGGSSESSDDHASPMDRSGIPFGNPAQAMQSIPMYANMGWGNSAVKMHHPNWQKCEKVYLSIDSSTGCCNNFRGWL